MNEKELCLALAKCDSEKEVIDLLKQKRFWEDKDLWVPFGGNENNFSIIGAQQSSPDAALVEKLINSVDSLLISSCFDKGIIPDSKQAPKSVEKAVQQFFRIPEGKLSNIDARERTKLAENIHLVASGEKTKPCYTIIDKGEGQSPNDFPNTFLSLNKSNKLRIPFVQGKFNMGGTGVLQFCGENNLQLLVSKRKKHSSDTIENKWGVTVIRRDVPSEGRKNSTYNYLAPNNEILSFFSDSLPLLPGKYPSVLGEALYYGSFIKLFDYDIKGYRTNILFDLYNRLSLLMPNLALPIRLSERRAYKGHSLETTLSGLSVRLEEDKGENLESNFPSSSKLIIRGNVLPVTIYAFKKDLEKNKSMGEKYRKNEGIVFSINGQSHGFLSNRFFTRNKISHSYLADSILLIVDCTNLNGRLREDLFMNSRDKLRDVPIKYEIEDRLEDLLSDHQGLKNLREKRRAEAVKNKIKDSKPFVDVLNNIMKKSPTLSKLFLKGMKIKSPFNLDRHKSDIEYSGVMFPDFFQLTKSYPFENPKTVEKNRRFRIQYKTNAENDYFNRDKDSGDFKLLCDGKEIDFVLNLWNGYANLNCNLPDNVKENSILEFQSIVNDVSRMNPFKENFCILVTEYIDHGHKKNYPSHRKKPSSRKKGNESEDEGTLSLPTVIEVEKSEWEKYGFDEYSSLKVQDVGDGSYDYFINIDNSNLLYEIKNTAKADAVLYKNRFKYAVVLIGIAILNDYKSGKMEIDEEEIDVFKLIEEVTKSVSPILLPLIEHLGDLEVN